METYDLYDPYGDDQSDRGDMDMDFLEVDLVRSQYLEASLCGSAFSRLGVLLKVSPSRVSFR